MRLLIESGADVNAKDVVKWTPVHYAAHNAKFECLQLLVDNGAKVNVADKGPTYPLHYLGLYFANCFFNAKPFTKNTGYFELQNQNNQ